MSLISVTSPPRPCGTKKFFTIHKKLFFTIFTSLVAIIFLVYIILHPSKPRFGLEQTEVYRLSLSTTHLLNSSIQLTVQTRNPNTKIGIYYDEVHVYAEYEGQQITLHSSIPPFYQGYEDVNIITASLVGTGLPVSPYFGPDLERDQLIGKLELKFKINGRIRWKVGTWVSGQYRLYVNCFAVMGLGTNVPIKSLGGQCSTTV